MPLRFLPKGISHFCLFFIEFGYIYIYVADGYLNEWKDQYTTDTGYARRVGAGGFREGKRKYELVPR
jgi:hypothetical protein